MHWKGKKTRELIENRLLLFFNLNTSSAPCIKKEEANKLHFKFKLQPKDKYKLRNNFVGDRSSYWKTSKKNKCGGIDNY